LSEQAAEQGLETDSWTVDSGEAPRERDWVRHQNQAEIELFYSSLGEAEAAASLLKQIPELRVVAVEEQKHEDWDAQWKASFLNAGEGVTLSPFWRVVPPWVENKTVHESQVLQEKLLKINPGAGFGTGTHETTQLCLEAIGESSFQNPLQDVDALDFGSGSGILSIGLALLGARVDAVEIDPLAIDNAIENAELNQVSTQIKFSQKLEPESKKYQYVIANILKPVLLEFSENLIARLSSGGVLILSGLIEKDVDPVVQEYARLLGGAPVRVYAKNEWRALVFRKV
jgi:ribosomal protein L11 methyltransferase